MKNRIFAAFSFILVIHMGLSLCFCFNIPVPLFNNPWLKYYQSYAAVGPFFTDNSVRSSYLMGVSDKQHPWSYPQLANHQSYLRQMNYQALKRAEFEKFLAWHVLGLDNNEDLRQYLLKYLRETEASWQHADSIYLQVIRKVGNYPQIDSYTLAEYQVYPPK